MQAWLKLGPGVLLLLLLSEARSTDPSVPTPCTKFEVDKRCILGHEGSVNSLDIADGRHLLLSGSEDGTVRAWDTRTARCVLLLSSEVVARGIPQKAVTSVALSRGSDYNVYFAAGSNVLAFDTRYPKAPEKVVQTELKKDSSTVSEHTIRKIAIDYNSKYLAAADDGGEIHVIDLQRLSRKICTLQGRHEGKATCLRWRTPLPLWQHDLVSGGQDSRLLLHGHNESSTFPEGYKTYSHVLEDMIPRKVKNALIKKGRIQKGQKNPEVECLDVSADGKTVALGAGDGTLRTFSLLYDNEIVKEYVFKQTKGCLFSVSPASTDEGSRDGRLQLWNLVEPRTCAPDAHLIGDQLILLEIMHGQKP
ncbi:hypothetical protein GUITHDRAFT_137945 [Guillardia theta CCMP2712]|uniref:Uncharacterized protein n=1 Tax=Guillardia theta (strain CCMP2712) TaxID=905079 RepID=L1JER2_GUITC|nr:hypothetical protein GUITHDRAFT_137945 [Guillardia theta CCMP2712]EKX46981.1 hypothetical protein GUITHDRAFT_137945 [Guillardia theta CCMP2712]|eukprot:XP_005833961.1 hypothetical protein GUITHDRAFT_137945 [Guillardia theta CCMP2712]